MRDEESGGDARGVTGGEGSNVVAVVYFWFFPSRTGDSPFSFADFCES